MDNLKHILWQIIIHPSTKLSTIIKPLLFSFPGVFSHFKVVYYIYTILLFWCLFTFLKCFLHTYILFFFLISSHISKCFYNTYTILVLWHLFIFSKRFCYTYTILFFSCIFKKYFLHLYSFLKRFYYTYIIQFFSCPYTFSKRVYYNNSILFFWYLFKFLKDFCFRYTIFLLSSNIF